MHEHVEMLFRPMGPEAGKQINISVTSTSAHIALDGSGDADLAGLVNAIKGGVPLELQCDDDVGFIWSPAASGETVSLAATVTAGTAIQQCKRLFQGASDVHTPPPKTLGLVVISVVASTILRVTVCGMSQSDRLSLNG
jgi:hypothetical protein